MLRTTEDLRIVKSIFQFIVFFLLFLALGLGLYIYLEKDRIIQAFVGAVNEQIDVEIQVGHIDLSVWDHLPYVSINMDHVQIQGSGCFAKEKLLTANRISILANPIALWNKNYTIERLVLNEGSVYLLERPGNCNNYSIIKKSDQVNTEQVPFELRHVELNKMRISYHRIDKKEQAHYDLNAHEALSKIVIGKSNTTFSIDGQFTSNNINIGALQILENFNFNIKSEWVYDGGQSNLYIEKFALESPQSIFNGSGKIGFGVNDEINLVLDAQNATIKSILELIPEKYSKPLAAYQAEGQVAFSMFLNGPYKKGSPRLLIECDFSKTTLYHPDTKMRLYAESGKGQWDIKALNNWEASTLKFSNVAGRLHENPFSLDLAINNFQRPNIQLRLETRQTLSDLKQIMNLPISEVAGEIGIQIKYQGLLPEKGSKISKNAVFDGDLELKGLHFRLDNNSFIENLNGHLIFSEKEIAINRMKGKADNSTFQIDGYMANAINYFLYDDESLIVSASLEADQIQLEDWLRLNAGNDDYRFNLSKNLDLDIITSIGQLKFKRFKAANVKGSVTLKNQELKAKDVKMGIAGGQVNMNLDLLAKDTARVEWFSEGHFQHVHIDSVFYIFENFNQDFIQEKNIRGVVDADITGFLLSDNRLNFDQNKAIVSIQARISNGKLVNFEPMQNLSRFAKEEMLMDLRFEDLENEIFIQNGIINIPKMEIRSNVKTIKIEGTHTFNNEIDYHLEIPVLRSKKLDKDSRFGLVEDEKTGETTLLLTMKGTTSDYKIEYDKAALKASIKEGIESEKKELRDLLKKRKEKEESVELEEEEYFDFN